MTSYVVPRDSHGLYWWHGQILADLREYGPRNVHALASNAGALRMDVARWVNELVEQGYVTDCEPEFDYPARWVNITDKGRGEG